MKRVLLSPILGMAKDRDWILTESKNQGYVIHEHIGKCILWGKSYHSYDHWVEEISSCVDRIARRKIKCKIKSKDIESVLLRIMGDEYKDAIADLEDIYEDALKESEPYPNVDLTYEHGYRFFDAYQEFCQKISYYIANHRHDDRLRYKDEIEKIVYSILNKYC